MIPAVKRNTGQFSRPGQPPEPDGLSGEGIFSDSECNEAASEKNSHTPSQSQGDSLKDTSDSSVSSYHTALCSEAAESFKDCVESLEDEGDTLLTQPPDGDPADESDLHCKNKTAPVSLSEQSLAGLKGFWRGTSEDPAEQLHGTPSDFDKATWELPDKNSKGAGDICAAASMAVVHSALNRSQASGGSLTTTAERTFSPQAGRECAASNQVCRYRGYLSAKEKQQVQMSITGPAKNSSAPGYSSRMGLATRELQPGDSGSKYLDPPLRFNAPKSREMFLKERNTKGSRAPVISKAPCPQYYADNSSAGSDSEEADNEVQKLTALSFRSLSCPHGGSLHMYSSSNRTSSSLSNSLSEDSNGMNRWSTRNELRKAEVVSQAKGSRQFPAASQVPEKDPPSYSFGKDPFECVDVVLESADGKKGHSKKRTVPKRQIQLKQRDRNEMNFLRAGDCADQQPFAAPRNDPCPKGRTISNEFRINYKQFLRTASLDDSYSKTRMASCLVKNVLAKKMQYEQRIRMEQKSMQGSSTSSVPSSVSTDLVGDFTEGKSSSLSKSDCSCSAEDLQSHSMSERSESMSQESTDAMRPTKGVVLNEQQRENVCKLKKTFNELNERLKSQEATQSKPLPILADGMNRDSGDCRKQVARERKEYWRARALFESKQAEVKGLGVAPTFSKVQKPWPSLKQRAISKNKHASWKEEKVSFKPESLVVPRDPARNIFTSTTQEMKLIPQSKPEQQQKMLNVSRQLTPEGGAEEKRPAAVQSTKYSSLILPTSCRSRSDGKSSPPEASRAQEAKKTESKGRGRIHQPRDVRKLVKNTYNLCFKSSDSFNIDQETNSGDSISLSTKESTTTSPLFIHCTSVCRKDDVQTKTHSHGKKQEQQLNLDVSALSIPDQRASDRQHNAALNHVTKPHVDEPVSLTENKCTAVGESPIHITQIQSKKKVVAGNEELQLKPENKPVCYERSELNVTPCSKATRKAPQMESQLNIKVNSSLSKHPHRTQADHFPAPTYSASDGRAMKDSSTQANCNSLEKSKAVLFQSSASPKDTKNHTDINRNTARPGHFQEAHAHKEPEWPFQKDLSTEIISLTSCDSQDFSVSPKEENNVSEQTKEGYRHLQPIKPTVTSTQTSHTNTPANNQSVNSSYQQKAQNKMFDTPRPLDSQVFVPATRMSPECANSNASLRSKEYSEETRLPGVLSAAPSPPAGKLQDQRENWDHLNRQQAGNEQYFTATHAENANYLTIPMKAQKPEAASKPLVPSHPDHTLISSNVFFQPGGEAPVSTISNESPQLKAPEGKAAADHSVNDRPSHVQPHHRVNDSPNFLRRNNGVSPGSRSVPSPTRSFAPQPQAHRKMLIDPDSGKCYYMEPPRQPQLKMLYDPETGQYLEVLIPPVPLASHSRLYPSPFNPLVMNPGVYGPPYIPYPGFPGFPPPPVAMPSVHPDLPNQQPGQENTNVTETFSSSPKGEAPPATQATDCNYMESLYYIPTGMNSSPSPNQPLFSPATSSSPSMPEKGPLFRM
ncbi:proline-rich basic protein 1 [Malaclemys terrapin pileata]|uniref:proline-rich basic protein 1 n=1 Tax=Malaclemys terrapin pileata TaxID=2991368 RepID=UPI0023A7F05A|nr:proline-rich basic protein 1 [Malaclemys terrapin pileata]